MTISVEVNFVCFSFVLPKTWIRRHLKNTKGVKNSGQLNIYGLLNQHINSVNFPIYGLIKFMSSKTALLKQYFKHSVPISTVCSIVNVE